MEKIKYNKFQTISKMNFTLQLAQHKAKDLKDKLADVNTKMTVKLA